ETAPSPPATAVPQEPPEPPEPPEAPAPAAPPQETTEEAEGTEVAESSKAQELPFLPSDAAEAGKKALAPHWSQRGGKWQTRGSRLSSDEEGELDDDEEAQRRKIERAQRAAERRAKSGKLKDAVARFQSDEESQGPAGPRLSPRSATLFRLAGELQTAPASDAATLLGILQELERLPATVELLRQTQLGVITQPFKDHGDPEVRALAKRLRRTWKDLIATAAGEAAAAMPPAPPPPETEAAAAASAVLSREPHHGMAPLMPGLEQEAEELLQELEEATSPERRASGGVRTAKVGGTDDADEVFGPTPRHEPNDHVGSPHRRPRPKAVAKASAVADADEVFGTTPRQDASGYQHAEQPPSASVPSEAKKPKFAALPKMPVQAKAPVQPALGELPDPLSMPAQTSVSVDETCAAPLPDMSADSSQANERHGVPAALKSALPRAPTASEPSAETAGYQEVSREAPAALKAPLPKAPLPKAPVPEVHQAAAPAPPTPHDPAQAAAPAPPTPHDTARAAPAPPTPHDTAWAAAPAPPTPHDTARAAAPAPPTPHDTACAAAPAPPTPHDTTQAMFEAPAVDSHMKEQTAMAPVPDPTPTTPVTAAAPAPPTAMPEAQKPAPSEKPKFAPLPSVPKLPPKPVAQPPKPAVPEASEESSEDELIPATPQGPPEEVAAPQPPLPKGPMPSAGYPKKAAPPQAPGPRVNAGLPAAARRQRMELVSNLQWLCRLFLETREQLFAAHEGTETEANCEGLREELDAVLFRRLLEETLTLPETAASPKSLIRLLRIPLPSHAKFVPRAASFAVGRAVVSALWARATMTGTLS
ncbi:unnamed protein product, partial [Symbiodinium sp. CCMP2456]